MARLGRAQPFAPIIRKALPAAAGSGVTGDLSVTLAALTLAASGAIAVAGALAVTLGALSLSAAGAIAVVGNAAITLGPLVLTSHNTSLARTIKRRLGIGISLHGN